jgi:Na+/H+ antiporter NhaC
MAWFLGMFIFFSDYFSPLFVGPVMKDLTDKAKISREKLAYICDSTSAPMSVLIPFSAWGVFISGLLVGHGPITDNLMAANIYVKSVGYNLYAILAVAMVGLIAIGIIPEFGPMKKAEERAMKEGKVLSDTAQPLMGVELSNIKPAKELKKPRLFINFILPVLIVICIAVGTYIILGSAKTLEAFMFAVLFLGVALLIQKLSIKDVFDTAVQGIKGVTPAILILAMAYLINTLSKELGTAQYVIQISESWMSPAMLPFLTFLIAAFISFSTGTSWGTYAIVIPIAVPMAFAFSGGAVTTLIYATIGAVAGGGVFGDHCSPLSDTTVLSSFGAASDHIDHVKTQLPYASVAAFVALAIYLVMGIL